MQLNHLFLKAHVDDNEEPGHRYRIKDAKLSDMSATTDMLERFSDTARHEKAL